MSFCLYLRNNLYRILSTDNQLLNQLLHDESFFRWVHRSDPMAVDYWEGWLAKHPEHCDVVAEATRLVRGISFAPRRLSEEQVHRAWLDLQTRLPSTRAFSSGNKNQRRWLSAAAVVSILLTGALVWWNVQRGEGQFTYDTAFGETQTIQLPDGSEVTLNANSRVKYRASADQVPRRDVWLEGEAFFRVVHREHPTPVPFVVHTPDLRVQVLGTEFNVNTRRGRTQVVLDKGSITLQLPSEETTALQPGELAEYTAQAPQVHKQTVDPERFTAWRNQRLTFDDTPLSEVALILEENYGIRVVFDSSTLRSRRVTGEISAGELKTILLAFSKLFDISVQQSGDTVHIAQHNVSP